MTSPESRVIRWRADPERKTHPRPSPVCGAAVGSQHLGSNVGGRVSGQHKRDSCMCLRCRAARFRENPPVGRQEPRKNVVRSVTSGGLPCLGRKKKLDLLIETLNEADSTSKPR
jgi:hypothetical protein